MKTQKKNPESFEEIIFRNRNKAYGAFLLRQTYARNLMTALAAALFVFSAFLSWAVWNVRSDRPSVPVDRRIPVDTTLIFDNNRPPEIPPDVKLPPAAPPFLKPVVVDSAVETPIQTQSGMEGNLNEPVTATTGPGRTDTLTLPEEPVNTGVPDAPVIFVEENPEYPGGDAERIKFLKNNLTYPSEAKELGISGTVYLEFIVERDGSISNISVKRGIGGGCDEEAVRVTRMMPKWKPGRQQGHEVRVQFILPIKFTLH